MEKFEFPEAEKASEEKIEKLKEAIARIGFLVTETKEGIRVDLDEA